MVKNKRPYLKLGIIFSNIIYLIFTIIFLINIIRKDYGVSTWVLLFYSIIMLALNFYISDFIESSKLIFKRKKFLIWLSLLFGFFYSIYLFIIFWYSKNTIVFALVFILVSSFILDILGMLTKVDEGKITYDEHIEKQNPKK